ncbi:DUF4129 domain-containing protein [Aquibacillus koreensis]|uniref:DUF4129 domain-containing protein n=1 Tax=Aquibacillus koreensis TaxID=279446 RepID=A0A9X4AIY6_9BACI|nr:transglutaminase domain-containing protein [Aquibacillus koreensis]MCT2536778.1 DUF4129 domain-containing protein [Aquibacillus koreensis]MDC3421466.1 DUF4129 domain-containing protein [Aquibacillus koreensis]
MDNLAQKSKATYSSLIYLCGFLLFWEWLRPLDTISDTGSLSVFVIYAAFCFFISILRPKWWLSSLLKLISLLFIIDSLFISEAMFSQSWFIVLKMHATFNMEVILNQQWYQMTPLFRSVLFLVLLWLMSYLLYYWFVVANRIFLFILLTFVYLTILDTFTTYSANAAIVRTFIISLIAMGISSISKEITREAIKQVNVKKLALWFIPLFVVIFSSTVIGYASPKLNPQWPDPVPFFTSTAEHAGFGSGGGNAVQKSGYGENDSRLGGSFVVDNSPVFQAAVNKSHYWRIESKDLYTGLGWERSTDLDLQEQDNDQIDLEMFNDSLETEDLTAMVRFEDDANLSKVVYPYGLTSIQGNQQVQYLVDRETGTIESEGGEFRDNGQGYQINYSYPSFSLDKLITSSEEDPEEISDLYLQLPDDLPERISALAEDVVVDDQTRYDMVKSIESYFNRNGYNYETNGVAVPEDGQDYVDQFLFDTKIGYCDNFSTSMVVMLRTLDIPARWVKGFTSGQQADEQAPNQDLTVYEVSNANAHSWVEVYFPDVGWVPFEPTRGFSSPVDFYEEASATIDDEQEEEETEETEETTEDETEEETSAADPRVPPGFEDFETGYTPNGSSQDSASIWGWVVAGVVLAVGASLLYLTRYRWVTRWLVSRYKKRHDAQAYQDAYEYLLKVLDHKGLKRNKDQTLREYARMIDKIFESNEMSRFTHHYERFLYRDEASSEHWSKMSELWENLIKRSLS